MIQINSYYGIAADLIMIIHFIFAAFVVLSVPIIWIGFFLKKKFVYNPIFRLSHLLAMGIIIMQALFGVICPLTEWEMDLRLKAGGGNVYFESFMQHWIHKILFFEASDRIFQWIYGIFFILIVLSMVIIKPVLRKSS
ncbi:DUF2784 domain-containing protein [Candidatus Magnetomoraceae bacterium gMMP-15]